MKENFELEEGRHGRERMVAGFITTYGISAYHHSSCEFKSHSAKVYSMQHYVTCDNRSVIFSGFLQQ